MSRTIKNQPLSFYFIDPPDKTRDMKHKSSTNQVSIVSQEGIPDVGSDDRR